MAWSDLSDLTMAICRDTFGETVGYTSLSGGITFQTVGIFDAEYKDVIMLDGAIVQSVYPRLGIRLEDFPVLPDRGDSLMIKSDTYFVEEFRPDGQAGATLVLTRSYS